MNPRHISDGVNAGKVGLAFVSRSGRHGRRWAGGGGAKLTPGGGIARQGNAVAVFQDVGGTDDAAAARPLLLAGGGPAEELEGEAQVAEGVPEEAAAAAGAIVIGGLILRPIHRFHPPPPPPATVGLGFHAMQCECLRIGFVLAPNRFGTKMNG